MDTLRLQRLEQWYQCFSLYGRFSTTEGNSSFFPVKRLLADGHLQYFLGTCFFAFPLRVDGVGVGTVEATERAALQKDDETESRPVECSHTFVRMNSNHSLLHAFVE